MHWEMMFVRKAVEGVRFRDFKDFNIALLAKQGWRILTESNCLMVRMLKARYFRDKSFKDSSLGDIPSAI